MTTLATMKAKSIKGSSQRKGTSSDFKKIKAKVGKRAPKKLNATDTSFQSSKVQLRSQQLHTATKLSSSINNESESQEEYATKTAVAFSRLDDEESFISQLTQSLSVALIRLNHPASQVRISVLETVRSILFTGDSFSWNSSPEKRRHFPLAIILPPLFKCLVDDEDQVRTLAISLLVDIVDIFQNNTLAGNVITIDMQLPFKPFIALFLAYIISAFHSLDRDTRYHSCIAFHLLSANFQSLVSTSDCYLQQIPSIVAAYVPLLADLSQTPRQPRLSGNKNRKSTQTKHGVSLISYNTPKSVGVLQSFQSFLDVLLINMPAKTSSSSLSSSSNPLLSNNYCPVIEPPHFTFSFGGHKLNALLCPNFNSNLHSVPNLSKWNQAVQFLGRSESYRSVHSAREPSSTLSSKVAMVLEKLRDRFVEVIQYEESTNIRVGLAKKAVFVGEGIFVPDAALDELSLLLNCFRKAWVCWCQPTPVVIRKDQLVSSTFCPSLNSVVSQFSTLLIESFPFKTKYSSRQEHQIHAINAMMACFILDLGHSLPSEKTYLPTFFKYCKSFFDMKGFEDDAIAAETFGESHGRSRVYYNPSLNSVALDTVLDLVQNLLLLLDHDSQATQAHVIIMADINESWFDLFSIFCDVFFPSQHSPSEHIMKSCGKKAVFILMTLFNQILHDGINIKNTQRSACILERMSVLPLYLECWCCDGKYHNDCKEVLAKFYSVARHGYFLSSDDKYSGTPCLSLLRNVTNAWKQSLFLFSQNMGENDDDTSMNDPSLSIPILDQRLLNNNPSASLPFSDQRLLRSVLGSLI